MNKEAKSKSTEVQKGIKVETFTKRRGISDSYFPVVASLPVVRDRDLEKIAELTASGKPIPVASALLLMRGSASHLLRLISNTGADCETKFLKEICSYETPHSNRIRNFDKDTKLVSSVKAVTTAKAHFSNESAKKDQLRMPASSAETRTVDDAQCLVISSSDGVVSESIVEESQKDKMSTYLRESGTAVDMSYWTTVIPARRPNEKQSEDLHKGAKIKFSKETPAVIDVTYSMAGPSRGVYCDSRPLRGNINSRSITGPVCSCWIKVGLIIILSIIFFATLSSFPRQSN